MYTLKAVGSKRLATYSCPNCGTYHILHLKGEHISKKSNKLVRFTCEGCGYMSNLSATITVSIEKFEGNEDLIYKEKAFTDIF